MNGCPDCVALQTELDELKKTSGLLLDDSMQVETCIEQIQLLKAKSSNQELNHEEAKRFEIYVKLLIALRAKKPAGQGNNLEKFNNQELEDLINAVTAK